MFTTECGKEFKIRENSTSLRYVKLFEHFFGRQLCRCSVLMYTEDIFKINSDVAFWCAHTFHIPSRASPNRYFILAILNY